MNRKGSKLPARMLLLSLLALPFSLAAAEKLPDESSSRSADPEKGVFGWVEMASLHPWNVQAKAKLDSGALTSSIHAKNIERFEKDGEEWVRFTIELTDENTGETFARNFARKVFRNVRIRGAGGEDRRPVVFMNVCIGNTVYQEQFNLENRDDMIYPILIGRRTIQHLGMIDVTQTFLQEPTCPEDSEVSLHKDRESADKIGI